MSIENNDSTRTELNSLGEFGLIDHLTQSVNIFNKTTLKGIGDDAAVICPESNQVLISTDLLIEGIHFDLTYMPLKHLGYKACTVNFSDIAAMNGRPKQITVSIAVSNRFSVEALEELYSGIHLACERYKVDLVGGDTASSPGGLFISVSVIGEPVDEKTVYRNGANKNDLVCVSGDLGAAYAGLLTLEREKATYTANPNAQPDLESYDYVLERQIKPEARLDIIDLLHENNIKPTSMIDISDGLASEILHICKQSDVGCELYEDKLPIDYATTRTLEEFKILPTTAALNGGEDYELLFTVRQSDYETIKTLKDICVIGYITDKEKGTLLITPQNTSIELKAQGWNHMR